MFVFNQAQFSVLACVLETSSGTGEAVGKEEVMGTISLCHSIDLHCTE